MFKIKVTPDSRGNFNHLEHYQEPRRKHKDPTSQKSMLIAGTAERTSTTVLKGDHPYSPHTSEQAAADSKRPQGPAGSMLTTEGSADSEGQPQGACGRLILTEDPGKSLQRLSTQWPVTQKAVSFNWKNSRV